MTTCIPVTTEGTVAHGWGRAPRVALAQVSDGRIESWTEEDVRWDVLHDEGTEGSHHARIARFLLDHDVSVVVAEHMGPGMSRMLSTIGIRAVLGAEGDARAAVSAAHQSAG